MERSFDTFGSELPLRRAIVAAAEHAVERTERIERDGTSAACPERAAHLDDASRVIQVIALALIESDGATLRALARAALSGYETAHRKNVVDLAAWQARRRSHDG